MTEQEQHLADEVKAKESVVKSQSFLLILTTTVICILVIALVMK